MQISVIIPSYKPGEYIWECLNSLVAQTFNKRQFEVILILNGCNEPYKSNIERYISTEGAEVNFVFRQIDVPGVSNARNIGLDIAQGDYIAFVDDDDYVSPSYLKDMYEIAIQNITPVSFTIGFDDITKRPRNYYLSEAYEKNKKNNYCNIFQIRSYFSGPWMKLLDKNNIGKHRFDTRLCNGEDSLFMFEVSYGINKVKLTNTDAIYYRRFRSNSAISNKLSFSYLFNLIKYYSEIYFKNPIKYNLFFFISRIVATVIKMVK